MSVETLIGRSLAVSVHPVRAWRVLRPSGRIGLVLGYGGLSYVGVLTALLLTR